MFKKLMLVTCLFSSIAAAGSASLNNQVVFVQHANSTVVKVDAKQSGSYQVTLHKPAEFVSYFSDRPARKTGLVPVSEFVKLWNANDKSGFSQDPPNAALESKDFNAVGTLTQPKFDKKTGDVSYRFTPLTSDKNPAKMNKRLGYTVLFIDDVSWDPGGFGTGN
jgi:hypothetical protein